MNVIFLTIQHQLPSLPFDSAALIISLVLPRRIQPLLLLHPSAVCREVLPTPQPFFFFQTAPTQLSPSLLVHQVMQDPGGYPLDLLQYVILSLPSILKPDWALQMRSHNCYNCIQGNNYCFHLLVNYMAYSELNFQLLSPLPCRGAISLVLVGFLSPQRELEPRQGFAQVK